jgi:hypothetical protein
LNLTLACGVTITSAKPLTITVPTPQTPQAGTYHMGEARRPDGSTLTLDSSSLRLNGRAWTPVMGEFHFSRYPASEWRQALLKMKAGGIDIVATYVFWIHHEEIEGQFDWSGRRNLRRFIQLCDQVGLKAVVRCGPWGHGEVRNGGHPDWILKKNWKLRSEDTNYLASTKILYSEIAKQLSGLLWKDGGPVIGIQFENESSGPASYLLALKRLGREVGLDVPLYTRTGWPALSTPLPFGEIVPLYGGYAEGFWDREITPMPGGYRAGFRFAVLRTDANIANEMLGRREARDDATVARYPYLTCEIGGGMVSSYHRRIWIDPADVDSIALIKLGSGGASLGYYMYHGGVNPEGKLSTLHESQATGYPNDLPVKSYDFQAPLGEYGQIRPQYHSLRRLHLFLQTWGPALAGMPPRMPDEQPEGADDVDTLRWSVRSNGTAGFLFVNNYQRLQELPPKTDVQFTLNLPGGALTLPSQPLTVPSGSRFLWPFNLRLAQDLRLAWATAQPVCAIDTEAARTIFFAEIEGVPSEFAFAGNPLIEARSGKLTRHDQHTLIQGVKPSTDVALQSSDSNGRKLQIVLLSAADSLALWKSSWQGRERVFLSHAEFTVDGQDLHLSSAKPDTLSLAIYPAPARVCSGGRSLTAKRDGLFQRFTPAVAKAVALDPAVESLQPAGPLRDIPFSKRKPPVAIAPEDADFQKAALWRIRLPSGLNLSLDPLVRLDYVGDVARVLLNGKLLTDNFYNGKPFEIALRRHAPEILTGDLQIAILPLRANAPIYLAERARPAFGEHQSIGALRRVDIVPRYQLRLTAE